MQQSRISTLNQLDGILKRHMEQELASWRARLRSDPEYVVNMLNGGPSSSSSASPERRLQYPVILSALMQAAIKPDSDTWKGLVDTGVISALCNWAATAEFGNLGQGAGAETLTAEEAELWKKHPAPYTPIFQTMLYALTQDPVPGSATQRRTVRDVSNNWTRMMKRVWQEPFGILEAEPREQRIEGRWHIVELVKTMLSLDSEFYGVLLDPEDRTLAVLLRNWIHTTADADAANTAVLLTQLLQESEETKPRPWRVYAARHSVPSSRELFTRAVVGANKASFTSDSAGRPVINVDPAQALNTILIALAKHLSTLDAGVVMIDVNFFVTTIIPHCQEDRQVFTRSLLNSKKLWAASVQAIRRANGTSMANAVEWVLRMYSNVIDVLRDADEQDVATTIIEKILAHDFFNAAEGSCPFLKGNAAGLFGQFMADIGECAPNMSAKASALVRSQLPRQKLLHHFMCACAPRNTTEIAEDFQIIAQHGPLTSNLVATEADGRYYAHQAWVRLIQLESVVGDTGGCRRRGCTKSAADSAVVCPGCKTLRYCCSKCLKRDKAEHQLLCKWTPLLERIREEDRAQLTGDATAQASVAGICSIVDGTLVMDEL
ncbi:hypothetical protein OH76DRAFT_80591 [Lentinus brumalis]|uniref:MYND-type domain-containing protein n=1 Tax=Lentinus brumalis TaxID=2498619 RepID=A0A371DL06_9APHY|nr:hypothetical protein OH76DRAFT_80591 [Polyporus brumalis]